MLLQDTIKYTRQKLFLSQEDFATNLCVSVATINRWENGRSVPNLSAMKRIKSFCKEHNISFEEIESEWLKQRMVEER